MFNKSEFFAAFGQHGLLADVSFTPVLGTVIMFKGGFTRPTELMLSDEIASDEMLLEYEVSISPSLAEGDELTIGSERFKVRSSPRARGDGSFAVVQLTKVIE